MDVAKRAGVSVATVSRVLNDSATVTSDTREKVLKAADELGYQINLLGRHLRCKKTNIILVMMPSLSNAFCSQVVRGIEKSAEKEGYFVMVNATGNSVKKQSLCLDLVKRKFADGIIMISSNGIDDKIRNIAGVYPIIQCSEYIKDVNVPFVSIDNFAAAYEATKHLVKCGRKKIVYLGANNELSSTRLRLSGFRAALLDNGIQFADDLVCYGEYMYKTSLHEITRLIKCGKSFDGVFAISDTMAAGAINALIQNGIKVPDDVAVTGFDNTELAYIINPAITTVSQPRQEIGAAAFEMLFDLINNKEVKSRILEYKLLIRNSTINNIN